MHDCKVCSRTFGRAEHLRRHVDTTHAPTDGSSSSSERYRCKYDGCGRAFTRSDALLRHGRIHSHSERSSTTVKRQRKSQPASLTKTPTVLSPNDSPVSRQGINENQHSFRVEGTAAKRATSWTQRNDLLGETSMTSQTIPMLEQPLDADGTFYTAPNANEAVSNWRSQQINIQENEQQHLHQGQNFPQDESYEMVINKANLQSLDLLGNLEGMNGSSSIPDHYFSGLDWIFDDLTDMTQPIFTSSSERSEWQSSGVEGGETYTDDDTFMGFKSLPDTTEALNLLNLANTAVLVSNGNQCMNLMDYSNRNAARLREKVGQPSSTQREGEAESSWPQEYRPVRKNPDTIELSLLSLTSELDNVESKGSAMQDGIILIDDGEDEEAVKSSRWKITETLREKLLYYLLLSCRHNWSIYSISPSPPSTFLTIEQLQRLVDLFFAKFHPFLPVIHAATFDPTTAPPILLLIVITIGLVFYPSDVAGANKMNSPAFFNLRKTTSTLACAFSELVRIGACSAYEADQRGFHNVAINSAWLLQQTFGIGSGDQRLNKIAERNRGGIVTAIRRIGILNQSKGSSPSVEMTDYDSIDSATCHKLWHSWIAEETRLRLGWFIYLYNQTFSCYLDVAPMLRYSEVTSSMPCHADLWNADNAETWMKRSRKAFMETTNQKTLHGVLRQILQPSTSSTATPLQINQFEAYILSVTLYRIRWDASKMKIVFDNGALSFGLDSAAAKAMQRLSNVAAIQSNSNRIGSGSITTPLAIDVQLFNLLAKLHFSGTPLFFDKLRDAAGRSGMTSKRRQEAINWLRDWMTIDASSGIAMRRMLLASSQIYALESSFSSKGRTDKGELMQSNVRTMSVFHAALSVWAYTQFSIEVSETSELIGSLPRIEPQVIDSLCEQGYLRLNGIEVDDLGQQGGSPSFNLDLIEAWICGRYVSAQDEQVYDWPLSPMAVYIEGIGVLKEQTNGRSSSDKAFPSRASHVLERFALLLARHDWGLAVSFHKVLLQTARHAVK